VLAVAIIGVVVGLLLGFRMPMNIPPSYARYLSIAVLATLDGTFGAVRASLENKFDNTIFVTGFFSNALLAAGFTYIGDRLGVELYNAAVFALGYRIFQNLGVARRLLLAGVHIPDEVKLKAKR